MLARGLNGLGMVRSLGMESVPVCFLQTEESADIIKSKYVDCIVKANSSDPEDILDALRKVPEEYGVLIAGSDYFIDLLMANKEELGERFKFILPKDSIVQMLNDKKFEVVTMGQHDVPVPTAYTELDGFTPSEDQLPLIIKPRTYEYFEELGKKNVIVNTLGEYKSFTDEFAGRLDHYIAQDIVVGDDENLWVCNCTFDHDSNLLQAFVFNRIRTYPAHYGVTSFARSKYNAEIESIVAKLGRALAYVGPAMVEFKLDDKDGKFKYIEINPRIGMCNIFDTKCGINNVYATYCLALDIPFGEGVSKQTDEVYYLCFYDDMKTRIKDGESLINILSSYANIIFKKKVFAYWTWDDMKPGMHSLQDNVKSVISRI